MSEEKFENINKLIEILTDYKDNIDYLKNKLDILNATKQNILKNEKFCDFGLILSNFDFKKDLLVHQIESSTKLLELFINRLYLDMCYIQSLLINIENILFDLNILVEKKIDKNIFKLKNIKISEFQEILCSLKTNYNLISGYLDKFYKKIVFVRDLINSQIESGKISNTMVYQHTKLTLEKNKIFDLINQTVNLYSDISVEYLKTEKTDKISIFEDRPKRDSLTIKIDNNIDVETEDKPNPNSFFEKKDKKKIDE